MKITKGTKAAVAGFAAIAVTVLCTASSCGNNPTPSGQQQENAQQNADDGGGGCAGLGLEHGERGGGGGARGGEGDIRDGRQRSG